MKTRAWESDEGSSTIVQFRSDVHPHVWMNTNMGWVPIGNAPAGLREAESFAETMAKDYGLTETHPDRSRWLAGLECDKPEGCRVCGAPTYIGELCEPCGDGNDPFFTSKYSDGARR